MSLKYEPASEPLHISAGGTAVEYARDVALEPLLSRRLEDLCLPESNCCDRDHVRVPGSGVGVCNLGVGVQGLGFRV